MISPRTAIAATLGLDVSELSEYRYQETRTHVAVYAVDNDFFIASKRRPKFHPTHHLSSLQWTLHPDQFWARQARTFVWTATSST